MRLDDRKDIVDRKVPFPSFIFVTAFWIFAYLFPPFEILLIPQQNPLYTAITIINIPTIKDT